MLIFKYIYLCPLLNLDMTLYRVDVLGQITNVNRLESVVTQGKSNSRVTLDLAETW